MGRRAMKNPGDQSDVESRLMEERVRKLDAEYGFHFSDEEIQLIARQTEKFERLFQRLREVDLSGVMPVLKLNRKEP
jgi:Asp-tRNA(Asn)/Glu-tRNA(Gln) amidotransferase C subunit